MPETRRRAPPEPLEPWRSFLAELNVLRDRYYAELRPFMLTRESWHDRTLDLWIEIAASP